MSLHTYYETIEDDLREAKAILAAGAISEEELSQIPAEMRDVARRASGTIIGGHIFAARKLLESFVTEIEQLQQKLASLNEQIERLTDFDLDKDQ